MKQDKSKPVVRSKNHGPRRRAILVLFRSGKFQPAEIAHVFGVTVADVWTEIRKALA